MIRLVSFALFLATWWIGSLFAGARLLPDPATVFATILAYRTYAYEGKGKEPPKTWADLFDVKKVPGRRSMRKHPFDTIEQAHAAIESGTAAGKIVVDIGA